MSQREVAAVLGVDPMTVNRDINSVENATKLDETPRESVAKATKPAKCAVDMEEH
jgi:hypothetical protein